MNILMFHNNCGSKLYRIYYPAKYIKNNTNHTVVVKDPAKGMHYDDLEWADVIVLEMLSDMKGCELFERRKKSDKPVAFIYELDDLMHNINPSNPAADEWNPKTEEAFDRTIELCDGMTVTTEYLKDYYGKKFPHLKIAVCPNSLDMDTWGRIKPPRMAGQIRLGWAGGISHKDDLMMVKPAIKKVLAKYPHVKFVHVGYGGSSAYDPINKYIYGDDLFTDIPVEQRELGVSSTPENWPNRLGTLGFDIGIAPITNDPWNHAKSNLKYLEYGCYGIPSVCSGGKGLTKLPYSYTIEQGVDGFLAETEDDWVKYLSKLIEDKELRNKIGANAQYKVGTQYNMTLNWVLWRDFYEDIYKKVSS
jgi:glycosyltransferase involved in cell wall biosynthesis